MRLHVSWALMVYLILCATSLAYAQNLQIPADYGIDIQLGLSTRSKLMGGSTELFGTPANQVGDEVFHRLIASGFSQPYPWKLTLVNAEVINASSSAGGQVYVYGGMLPMLGQNKGLWAAVLSHETAHTGSRHQVKDYLQREYIQRMIQYYRLRARAGDRSANWALVGFTAGSAIALKKMEREQEHDADQQGMLLMARAGYHPDYVFALHHLLLMKSGEQSKFAAFFSDHPRWETRDQRSDKVYTDALAEFNRYWPDSASSPGGPAPLVAFIGQAASNENKKDHTLDITVPVYCRNAQNPVELVLAFQKDKHPVRAAQPEFADRDGNLSFRESRVCLDKEDALPMIVHFPAGAVSDHDRSLKASVYIEYQGDVIARSNVFDAHFPKPRKD